MPFICEDSDELLQILQRSLVNSSYFDNLAKEKLAVLDDLSQKLIPPFPSDIDQKVWTPSHFLTTILFYDDSPSYVL